MIKNKTEKFRSNKSKGNFTQVSNKIILDPSITPNEKVILLYVFMRPDNWNVSMADVSSHTGLGITSLKTAMKGLKEKGFVKTTTIRENGRICGTHYIFIEEPESYNFQDKPQENNVSDYDFCEAKTERCTRENCCLLNTELNLETTLTTENSKELNTEDGNLSSDELTTEKSPIIILNDNNTKLSNTNNTNTNVSSLSSKTDDINISSPETKTKSQSTFPKVDYDSCFKLYEECYNKLLQQKKVFAEKPIITLSMYKRFSSTLKECFSSFGVEKTKKAIVSAMNDNWILQQGFKLECVFGKNKLPALCNSVGQPQQQFQKHTYKKQSSFFSSTSENINFEGEF